jgi:HAD superfamily hydrolase (TIGR01509 family)
MIRGILFDMDGVLVDSEEYICRAAIMMFRENGIDAKAEDFLPFVGMGEDRYLGGVALKYWLTADIEEIKARTYQIYAKITKGKIPPLPGAIEFVKQCRNRGLKLALATSADRFKMEINLKEMGLSEGSFDSTVNGLEVTRKKPFPDIYLEAAARLGLKPEECLVIEDAVSGVKAGKAAGCKCLALTTSFKAEELKEADWICGTLADVPEEALGW